MIQKLGILIKHYPALLGFDIAGDVVELGEGVTQVEIGDKV
jgi:NADPH:quinone reductase-like Zn-dependent oxidoreductase